MEKEMAGQTQQCRRIYFIEKSFQTKFILRFCGLVVAGGLLTVGIMYLWATQSTTVAFVGSRVVVKTTADFILPILIQTVVIVMIFVSLATVAITLFVSHKMSGPLFRFKEVMDAMGEGDYLSDFKVRELDQLQDFAATFNDMINKMRASIDSLKDNSKRLEKNINGISEGGALDQKKIEELKNAAAELNKALSQLKT